MRSNQLSYPAIISRLRVQRYSFYLNCQNFYGYFLLFLLLMVLTSFMVKMAEPGEKERKLPASAYEKSPFRGFFHQSRGTTPTAFRGFSPFSAASRASMSASSCLMAARMDPRSVL